jgi:hypothetical protein
MPPTRGPVLQLLLEDDVFSSRANAGAALGASVALRKTCSKFLKLFYRVSRVEYWL